MPFGTENLLAKLPVSIRSFTSRKQSFLVNRKWLYYESLFLSEFQATNANVSTCVTNCVTWSRGRMDRTDTRNACRKMRGGSVSQSKMSLLSIICTFLSICFVYASAFSPPKYSSCISKDFGHGGTVCVCSEDHCDSFSKGTPLEAEEYAVYTSTKAGDRFKLKTARFNKSLNLNSRQINAKLIVNASVTFQKILGFGGAFTGM